GENRPLIVIDGIPADNTNVGRAGLFGGRDSGDGLTAINPDDIATVTVLRGPAAAALYGSRAGNGVLLITTKKGAQSRGLGIELNSNYVTENVALLPNYQQEFGQGANGQKPTSQQEAFDNWRSWGARLDGSPTPIFNGEERPYSAVGQDDIREYYQTGNTWTNSLSLTGGNEQVNGRLSLSNLRNNSIVPNTRYERNTILLFTRAQLGGGLSLEGKVNYAIEQSDNRTNLTDNPSNPAKYFTIGPANLPQEVFRQTRDADRNPIYWSNNPFTLSPYWGPIENTNEDEKIRLLGYVSANWQLTDWLSIQGRLATDESTQNYFNVEIDGTQHNMPGSIFIDDFQITERNYDLLIRANRTINDWLGLDVNLGAARTDRRFRRNSSVGTQFINPGFLSINNMAVRFPANITEERFRINGLFATATFSVADFLYLEGSLRNDYFSVLTNPNDPENSANSILYGSGSLSFIATDAFDLPDWLSFAKLRLGLGSSGFGQIDPYSQVLTFAVSPLPIESRNGSVTAGNIAGDEFSSPTLEPSRTNSLELGADFAFIGNRFGLEVTYYDQRTDRHVFPSPLPPSSGFDRFLLNAGEVRNSGIELLVRARPVETRNFRWDISLNYSRNRNEVISLIDGIDQLNLGQDRTFNANIVAQVGGQIGDIWGTVFARNDAGDMIFGEDGLPQVDADRQVLGNFNPDWYGGLTSTFTLGQVSLSVLIDTKQGGEILSTTSSFGYIFGRHPNSLAGRDNPDFMITGQGVGLDGQSPNTASARTDDYYGRLGNVTEINVYDASYIKLRQLSLSYQLGPRLLAKMPFLQGATLSLVGRNLFFFSNGLDELGLDPEAIYTATGNDIGIEYSALPSTRTFGFNLNLKF
ncbi:MAG: SusC/RagA family TonB-linked outer membrane protein, partial [Bacteroidota bacterium]